MSCYNCDIRNVNITICINIRSLNCILVKSSDSLYVGSSYCYISNIRSTIDLFTIEKNMNVQNVLNSATSRARGVFKREQNKERYRQ